MNDRLVVLTIVCFLGVLAWTGLGGVIFLLYRGVDASAVAVVAALAGGAAGSLGTLLATTRTSASDVPTPVTVMNPPAAPVQTTDVDEHDAVAEAA